jgi:hypothetical protein
MNPALFLRRRKELLNTGAIPPDEIKQIVALELMNKIAEAETGKIQEKSGSPRIYYLTLYSQALRTVSGDDVEDILEEKP